jgi:2-polyprenyl-6-hydroxyphenyl methylase/3-demethylubiquinone-9 3-methyltransferase
MYSGATVNDLSIYDKADWWNPLSSFAILHRMNEVRVPYFVSRIAANSTTVLDLGCGGGLVSEAVAAHGFQVTGMDISKKSVEVATTHARIHAPGNIYLHGSIFDIPFPDNSADAVIVSDVLEHLHDVLAALAEVHRVLRPKGVLVFDTIAKTPWSWLTTYFFAQQVLGIVEPGAHDWAMFIKPADLEQMLTTAGFTTDRNDWAGIVGILSPGDVLKSGNKYSLISRFETSTSDFSSSYMGYAIKP